MMQTAVSPDSHIHYGASTPTTEINGRLYMEDPKGALVPVESIKPQDKLMDEVVGKIFGFAKDLSAQMTRFKEHTFADINDYQALLEQHYGARAGGAKGNVTLTSFDGLRKVAIQVADRLDFGPELQVAKKLVDECLIEWSADSNPELRSIVNRAFSVDQAGKIKQAELFSILRLEIEDPRWQRAMQAIRDSIRVTGSKEYVRFYERASGTAPWMPVSLDIATL
jgi:Protein of unknown function (DUF3164)